MPIEPCYDIMTDETEAVDVPPLPFTEAQSLAYDLAQVLRKHGLRASVAEFPIRGVRHAASYDNVEVLINFQRSLVTGRWGWGFGIRAVGLFTAQEGDKLAPEIG